MSELRTDDGGVYGYVYPLPGEQRVLFHGDLAWNGNHALQLVKNRSEGLKTAAMAWKVGHFVLANPPEMGWIYDNPETTEGTW